MTNPEKLEPHLLKAYSLDAVEFATRFLHWTPDPKQALVLASNARRVILNCSRQWGKTTVAATKIVHVAVTRPKSTALVVCENMAQTGELFQKVDSFLSELGLTAKGEAGKRMARRLENGSRIVGIAAREPAVRGYTADFVFLDEAARISDEVIDAFGPTIAVRNGDWWMASTPRGRRGRFFEMWTYAAGPGLLRICAPSSENPRIDPSFVERARAEKGDDYVKQEFECEFVETGTNLMSLDQIDSLIRK